MEGDRINALFRQEVIAHRADRLYGEVLLSQPLSTRVMVIALAVICSAVTAWLASAHYARTETAPGVLVTDKPSAKVVPMVPGVLATLRVGEGSLVRKNDVLAVIAVDRTAEGRTKGTAGQGIATVDARIAIGDQQVRLSAAKQTSERARLASVLASSQAQASSLEAQLRLQREIVASNRSMFEQLGSVVDHGFVSKVEYERRRQTWLNAQQGLDGLEQQLLAQKAQIEQARAQIASLLTETAREVGDIKASMQALVQQRAQLEGERSYAVRAPMSGRITAVQVNTGGVVTPTGPLLTIVPDQANVKAEIYAASRAIGFVHPGQEARLLYDAFPYQQFGSFRGIVTSVSRVVIDPREALLPVKLDEPAYKVTVQLDQQTAQAFGHRVPLQTGMALRATLILERQSFLDWLLTPLRAVMNRNG